MIAEILAAVSKDSSNCHADRSACKAVMRSQGLPAGYVHPKTSAELTVSLSSGRDRMLGSGRELSVGPQDSEIKDLLAAIAGLGFTPE